MHMRPILGSAHGCCGLLRSKQRMLIQDLFDAWKSSQVAHIAAETAAVTGRDSAVARV